MKPLCDQAALLFPSMVSPGSLALTLLEVASCHLLVPLEQNAITLPLLSLDGFSLITRPAGDPDFYTWIQSPFLGVDGKNL